MGSILDEVRHLSESGVKEVTLLGQNVNSYRDMSEESHPFIRFTGNCSFLRSEGIFRTSHSYSGSPSKFNENKKTVVDVSDVALAKGFKSKCKVPQGGLGFADLLHQVARVDPELRIRFTSPHPKDFPNEVLCHSAAHGKWAEKLIGSYLQSRNTLMILACAVPEP